MFCLIKHVFVPLLKFTKSLGTKCVSLNNESCIARPTLIDLNPIELNYYPFMISPDKCNGSFNAVDDLPMKICVLNKTKDENIKIFDMITRIYENKTLV